MFFCLRPFFNILGLNNTDNNLLDEMKEQQIIYQKYLGTHTGSDTVEMSVGARKVQYY